MTVTNSPGEIQMSSHPDPQHYLGVPCQNCGEIVAVPAHVMDRQIALADDSSDTRHCYISTLLNLRCHACCREFFYAVDEITQFDGIPPLLHRVSREQHPPDAHGFLHHSHPRHRVARA
jgi:hypothetical protein